MMGKEDRVERVRPKILAGAMGVAGLMAGGWIGPETVRAMEKRRTMLSSFEPVELTESDLAALKRAEDKRQRRAAKRRADMSVCGDALGDEFEGITADLRQPSINGHGDGDDCRSER